MNLKVGDKVLIRDDLVVGTVYGMAFFVIDMRHMVGKIAVISSIVNECHCAFRIVGNRMTWTSQMCVGKVLDDNKLVKIE